MAMAVMWSNDPIRDAARYYDDLEEAERQYRHCYGCGNAFFDGDTAYELEGCEYCAECIKEEIGKVVHYDD